MAARNGATEMVQSLLRAGVDTTLCDQHGTSAFIKAAGYGRADILALLWQAAQPNMEACDMYGWTAFMYEVYHGAVYPDNAGAIHFLIDHGANLETRGQHGQTPLMVAAKNGHSDAIRILIAAGAKLEAKDQDGQTALMVAAYFDHSSSVKVLHQFGAAIDRQDRFGKTARMWATENRCELVAHFLDDVLAQQQIAAMRSQSVRHNLNKLIRLSGFVDR